jgi:hypothetical protein
MSSILPDRSITVPGKIDHISSFALMSSAA